MSRHVAPRPQPLGLFPLPLGYMLIPAGADTDDAREAMLAGRLPESWPPSLRAHELAAAGKRDAAITQLQEHIDPVATYNRFVLDPDSVDSDTLRAELGEFAILVDVVLFALGRTDTPPRSEAADGEIAAALLSTEAGHALSREISHTAIELLDRAARGRRAGVPAAGGDPVGRGRRDWSRPRRHRHRDTAADSHCPTSTAPMDYGSPVPRSTCVSPGAARTGRDNGQNC